jgi:hypothetical protein
MSSPSGGRSAALFEEVGRKAHHRMPGGCSCQCAGMKKGGLEGSGFDLASLDGERRGCSHDRRWFLLASGRLPGGSLPEVRDGLQVVADFGELGVDLAREIVQAGDCHQRNERCDHGVLNQILTRFVVQKVYQNMFHDSRSPESFPVVGMMSLHNSRLCRLDPVWTR